MIEYRKGDLLSVDEGIIIHGCNAQGVMGAGVAKAIKAKYPDAYKAYKYAYDTVAPNLGDIIWYRETQVFYIANAITQEFYGKDKRYVNYKAIVDCFTKAIVEANYLGLDLHFPKIGAGLAGGDWNIIEQLINDCDPTDTVRKVCWTLE